jgi:hypothetical protein
MEIKQWLHPTMVLSIMFASEVIRKTYFDKFCLMNGMNT